MTTHYPVQCAPSALPLSWITVGHTKWPDILEEFKKDIRSRTNTGNPTYASPAALFQSVADAAVQRLPHAQAARSELLLDCMTYLLLHEVRVHCDASRNTRTRILYIGNHDSSIATTQFTMVVGRFLLLNVSVDAIPLEMGWCFRPVLSDLVSPAGSTVGVPRRPVSFASNVHLAPLDWTRIPDPLQRVLIALTIGNAVRSDQPFVSREDVDKAIFELHRRPPSLTLSVYAHCLATQVCSTHMRMGSSRTGLVTHAILDKLAPFGVTQAYLQDATSAQLELGVF